MSTRANWHTAELDLDDPLGGDDPFAMPIEEVGDPIDLRDRGARLQLRLRELCKKEGNLDRNGVTCPIKDRPDTSCLACPISEAADDTSTRGPLCRIGREQERVCTELAVERARDAH